MRKALFVMLVVFVSGCTTSGRQAMGAGFLASGLVGAVTGVGVGGYASSHKAGSLGWEVPGIVIGVSAGAMLIGALLFGTATVPEQETPPAPPSAGGAPTIRDTERYLLMQQYLERQRAREQHELARKRARRPASRPATAPSSQSSSTPDRRER